MEDIRLKVIGADGKTLAVSHSSGDGVALVHTAEYLEGDLAVVCVREDGLYAIRLDEALVEAVVFLQAGECIFPVPCGNERICYSPKAFVGSCHLMTARFATAQETAGRHNVALNPYDSHKTKGIFPHAEANVETRGEAVFAARNAIDGIYENQSHGVYPYSSWGINRDPAAELKLDFSRPVTLDAIRLTLRADFPHDNWWKQATVKFSDGSAERLELQKTHLPQETKMEPRTVEWLVLCELIASEEPSPFPALTQIEAMTVEE